MQPQAPDNRRADGFKPKWRHFHHNDRVWVQNPFPDDIVYSVADEYNRPFRYRLVAGKVSELPGGAIATLGVKAIVDQLIQNSKEDAGLMWDERIRAKYEKQVILRVKETTSAGNMDTPGEINLSAGDTTPDAPAETEELDQGNAFDDLNAEPAPSTMSPAVDAGLKDVVNASLPATDAVVGPNNTYANAED